MDTTTKGTRTKLFQQFLNIPPHSSNRNSKIFNCLYIILYIFISDFFQQISLDTIPFFFLKRHILTTILNFIFIYYNFIFLYLYYITHLFLLQYIIFFYYCFIVKKMPGRLFIFLLSIFLFYISALFQTVSRNPGWSLSHASISESKCLIIFSLSCGRTPLIVIRLYG